MSNKINIDQMADTINEMLQEYAELATDEMKTAVKKVGEIAKKEIKDNAPEDTGKYAKSWTSRTTKETLQVTVYSSTRYRLAHLLENGHAKRGGGRVAARPHIAPAEQHAEEELVADITRALEKR